MKRQILIGILSSFVLLSLDSCTHYYYAPNQHNVPLFKEKNEVRLSGSYLSGDEITGCDIQTAYAITKESAIMANAFIAGTGTLSPTSNTGIISGNDGGKGQLYEIGAGYYKPLKLSSEQFNNKIVVESYAVVGLGNVSNYYGNTNYTVSTNLLKTYLQPSIGYTSNLFDLILSAKIGTLYTFGTRRNMSDSIYNNLELNNSSIGNDLNILYRNRLSFLFEPAFTFRLGFKYVKLHFQVGTTIIGGGFHQLTPIGEPAFDAGLTIFIAKRFWQKDERPKKQRWREMFD
jgi:hypothetical protein